MTDYKGRANCSPSVPSGSRFFLNMSAIIEAIKASPRFQPAKAAFVSVYRTQRCYGGPEEGGWWHDRTILEGSIPFASMEAAEEYLAHAERVISEKNADEHPERVAAMANLPDEDTWSSSEGFIPSGWSDGGELFVHIEDARGSLDNSKEPRPHYE